MTANNLIDKVISPLIPAEFPQFYASDGPMFMEFVQAYYRWLEQSGNPQYKGSITTESRSLLSYWDIDSTSSKFLKYFEDTFLANIPTDLAVDPRFLIKHVLDFYRTKGSVQGFETLFKILYNQDITVNIPGQYMFRLSSGNWNIPRYIEVSNSPFLSDLGGRLIRNASGTIAIVESYNQKIVNNKFINILYLSSLTNNFNFGDLIFCDAIPEMANAPPLVIGSLSTITIDNGGVNFNIGDELRILGTGSDGKARVVATTSEDGKVKFTLLDGGYGFSSNAVITIDNTGTGGTGASFQIGGIVDEQVVSLNTDVISGLLDTVMDLSVSGYEVGIANASENFVNDELAQGTALSRHLNVKVLSELNGPMANGESVSNSALSISVVAYFADGQDIYLTGNNAALTNANLVSGSRLVSNITGVIMETRYLSPVVNVFSNGYVISSGSNTSVLSVNRNDANDIGYYIPGMIVTGSISGANAAVTSCKRLTDWNYFAAISPDNLDKSMGASFNTIVKEIGTIAFLTNENPGNGYIYSPAVSIVEPLIYDLRINDGFGGYWGYDAAVNAYAGNVSGIVTAISIDDAGFGWSPNEGVLLINSNNDSAVFGKAVVSSTGIGQGSWSDTQSFLDDVMVLQDDYYYQTFSYEIVAEKMLSDYDYYLKQLAHPVGYALFGKYAVNRHIYAPINLISSAMVQEDIVVDYTADSILFTGDNSELSVDQITFISAIVDTSDAHDIITSDGNNVTYSVYRPIIISYGNLVGNEANVNVYGITTSDNATVLLSSNININDTILTSNQDTVVIGS